MMDDDMTGSDDTSGEKVGRRAPDKLIGEDLEDVINHCAVACMHLMVAARPDRSSGVRLRELGTAEKQISRALALCLGVEKKGIPTDPFNRVVSALSKILRQTAKAADRGEAARDTDQIAQKANEILSSISGLANMRRASLTARYALVANAAMLDELFAEEIAAENARYPDRIYSQVTYADRMKFVLDLPSKLDALLEPYGIARRPRRSRRNGKNTEHIPL